MICSTQQALSVWADLESAYRGDNGFGGETAEIYAYRLLPHAPSAGQNLAIYRDEDIARARAASDALAELLVQFLSTHRKGTKILVDGTRFSPKKKLPAEPHRWHVTVIAP